MAATNSCQSSNAIFSAADTAQFAPGKDEVKSPSLSNANALARFEFEPGLSKEGTKILMIEWEDDVSTRTILGSWQISWESKTHVLPVDDTPTLIPPEERAGEFHRMYFLLPPGVPVPGMVILTKGETYWRTNPLPAIFPPELGASARQAGKKGVLHTIWAKKRLQALQREIDTESQNNVEGIGLTMALQEKEWIEQNFGVSARPSGLTITTGAGTNSAAPLSPGSPKSPGGGRLMEKLKGLKLSTTDKEHHSPGGMSITSYEPNTLSPESSDVAVSSFSTFKGAMPSQVTTKLQFRRKVSTQGPPAEILAQQQQQHNIGIGSLDAFAVAPAWESRGILQYSSALDDKADDDKEDGLFAVPISPRSPEMTKSPFSFARNDISKYV
ncbi:hypothetical protein EJ05DRAFT_480692, partial [Pseudovirgaria hyperparasitica]